MYYFDAILMDIMMPVMDGYEASVKARSNGEKCPICSGARVIAGKINIKNTFLTSLYGGKCTFSDV